MKKRGIRISLVIRIFIIILLLIMIGAIFYLIISMSNKNEAINDNLNTTQNNNSNNFNNKIIEDQFPNIEELHWTHMPITYKIENECVERQINLTRLAFKSIEKETDGIINFIEVSESPDISIYCKPDQWKKNEDYFIADALYYANSSNNSDYKKLITHADVDFYGQGMVCDTGYPELEVHEILHTFGFKDDVVLDRVMSRYAEESSSKCKIKSIEKEDISCLKYIYTNGNINGTCSRLLLVTCKNGYIVSRLDNQCHKECDTGYIMYSDYNCYQNCSEGYVLGQDYECHQGCGKGYCEDGTICKEKRCYIYSCPNGYSLGKDNLCYSEQPLGHTKSPPINVNENQTPLPALNISNIVINSSWK